MRVPDGEDYVEFMLYTGTPSAQDRGVKNHLSLEVPDIGKAVQDLEQRPARKLYTREIKTQVGKNRKRQANLFDPDGTRVELMEPKTVDGQPAPSSTAPPPKSRGNLPSGHDLSTLGLAPVNGQTCGNLNDRLHAPADSGLRGAVWHEQNIFIFQGDVGGFRRHNLL